MKDVSELWRDVHRLSSNRTGIDAERQTVRTRYTNTKEMITGNSSPSASDTQAKSWKRRGWVECKLTQLTESAGWLVAGKRDIRCRRNEQDLPA